MCPAACYDLPRRALHGRALWLELSRDPARLPSLVPSAPDFSLHSCRITTASSTHHRGTRLTLPSQPCSGFSPVRHIQGWRGYPRARFDVAQHRFDSRYCPAGSEVATGCDVRRSRSRESHPTALLVCRTSPIRGMRLQAMPSNSSHDARGRLSCRCRSWWRQDRCDGLRVRGVGVPRSRPIRVCAGWLAPVLRDVSAILDKRPTFRKRKVGTSNCVVPFGTTIK